MGPNKNVAFVFIQQLSFSLIAKSIIIRFICAYKNCIANKCALKVQRNGDESKVKVAKGSHKDTFQDGPLHRKIMISRITIERFTQSALSELDKHMAKIYSDVIKLMTFLLPTPVLKLLKNMYGLEQAGKVWNKHLN